MGSVGIEVNPISKPFDGSDIDFGAQITGINVENLDGKYTSSRNVFHFLD